jgi:hypothetical protein
MVLQFDYVNMHNCGLKGLNTGFGSRSGPVSNKVGMKGDFSCRMFDIG